MTRALAVLVVAWGSVAVACSCDRALLTYPPSGSVVPTNVVVQVSGLGLPSGAARLRREGSADPIALEQQRTGLTWLTLAPRERLPPRTTLVLDFEGAPEPVATFTTGEGPDETPPSAPVFRTSARFVAPAGNTCGGESVTLTADAPTDTQSTAIALIAFSGPTVAMVDAERGAAFLPSIVPGTWQLSDSLCDRNFPLSTTPELALGLRAIDWAGNLSELSEVKQVKTAGCAVSPSGAVLVLSALLLRRRLHRR